MVQVACIFGIEGARRSWEGGCGVMRILLMTY
jgi:hypothetical protein